MCVHVTALDLPWQEHLRVARGAWAPLDHAGLPVETTDCVHKQPLTHACRHLHARSQITSSIDTDTCVHTNTVAQRTFGPYVNMIPSFLSHPWDDPSTIISMTICVPNSSYLQSSSSLIFMSLVCNYHFWFKREQLMLIYFLVANGHSEYSQMCVSYLIWYDHGRILHFVLLCKSIALNVCIWVCSLQGVLTTVLFRTSTGRLA